MNSFTILKNEPEQLVLHTNDPVEGFNKAADPLLDPSPLMANLFKTPAITRSRWADTLNDRSTCIGKDEQEEETVMGAIHRLRSLFTFSDRIDATIDEAIPIYLPYSKRGPLRVSRVRLITINQNRI